MELRREDAGKNIFDPTPHIHRNAILSTQPTGNISFSDVTGTGKARQHIGNHYGEVTNNFYGYAEAPVTSPDESTNRHWLVRRRPNVAFTGQEGILQDMHTALFAVRGEDELDTRQFVLQGMGGIGKSELALQFARRHRALFWAVFWIDFGDLKSARANYGQIAAKCGLVTSGSDDIFDEVNSYLSSLTKSWLLVLDNCDDPQIDYSVYLPDSNSGCVIMTTRLDIGSQYGTSGWHQLHGLERESAVELLAKVAGISKSQIDSQYSIATELVLNLGLHPLAVNVVGSILREGLFTLEEYTSTFAEKEAELLRSEPRQYRSTYGTVHATFEISVEKLSKSKDVTARYALELLEVLAFLDRNDVAEDIFSRAWEYAEHRSGLIASPATTELHHGWIEAVKLDQIGSGSSNLTPSLEKSPVDDIWTLTEWHSQKVQSLAWAMHPDMLLFRKARAHLSNLALVQRNPDTQTISMHPLIHGWARNRLYGDESRSRRAWETAACFLALSTRESWQWEEYYFKLPRHLEVCFDLRPPPSLDLGMELRVGQIYYAFVRALTRRRGVRTLAILVELECLLNRVSGQCDVKESLLDVQHWKAETLMELERHEEAKQLLEAVFNSWPHKQGVRFSLAIAYCETGKFREALQFFEELVYVRESTFPPDHPGRLTSQQMLGRVYTELGQLAQAIEILQKVVAIRAKTVDPEHPQLLVAQHELARAYHFNGQCAQSVPILEAVVRVKTKTMDRTDAERFMSEYNLIDCYFENRQPKEALVLLEKIEEQKHLLIPQSLPRLRYLRLRLDVYEQDQLLRDKLHCSQLDEANGDIDRAIKLTQNIIEAELKFPPVFGQPWLPRFVLARQHLRHEHGRGVKALFDICKEHRGDLIKLNPGGTEEVNEMERAISDLEEHGQARWSSPVHMWTYRRRYNG